MEQQDNQDKANFDRPGYVIWGARNIAEYMKVSPGTISRWRKRFRGRTDILLCFPAVNMPTGTGRGWELMTHTGLILDWMQRWSEIDGKALRQKPTWRRRRKAQTLGETPNMSPAAGKERPTLREELDQLTPAEREWIIKNELTPAQREELGGKVAETPGTPNRSQHPGPIDPKRCSCGTPELCTAH
jgi:hypothetical protein